jgi:hypothetical protein
VSDAFLMPLFNPTPWARTMTLRQGEEFVAPDGTKLTISEDTVLNLPALSERRVAFGVDGNLLPGQQTLDDAAVTTVHAMDLTSDESQFVPLGRNAAEWDLNDSKRGFSSSVRQHCRGIVEDDARHIGGFSLLSCYSRARSERSGNGLAGIYSPAALGMEYDCSDDSLYSLALNNRIEIQSIIGNGHNRDDAILLSLTNSGHSTVVIHIAPGTMFEQQQSSNQVQNLVVKVGITVTVNPGATVDVAISALCGNMNGASPDQEPLSVTPFRIRDGVNLSSQGGLWSFTDGGGSTRM